MAAFVEVASVQELPPGTGRTFHVGDKEIAIFNVDGEVYAIDDACAHAGASLGAGKLQGKVLTCRAHGFRYDVTTGGSRRAALESLRIRQKCPTEGSLWPSTKQSSRYPMVH